MPPWVVSHKSKLLDARRRYEQWDFDLNRRLRFAADLAAVCNLYSQTRNVEAIRSLFRIAHNRATAIEPQPAIFPGWTALVRRQR